MTLRLRCLSRKHQHSSSSVAVCCAADGHAKTASSRRAGAHKAAVSHFGQVKLQLTTPKSVTKVKLSEGSKRAQSQERHDEDSAPRPSAKAPLTLSRPKAKPSLKLGETGLRQELLEIMHLYNVSPADANTPSADLISPKNSLVSVLADPKSQDFAAAGIISISFWPPDGHIRILMTQEAGRKSKWHKKLVKEHVWQEQKPYGIPGGKRHKCECNPRATALREVTEETAGLLSAHNLALPASAIYLKAPANYYAFLLKMEDQKDLPKIFAKLLADPKNNLAECCTTKALAWVPVRDLARWPRGHFFDKLLLESVIPAWLCAEQREYDQRVLESG